MTLYDKNRHRRMSFSFGRSLRFLGGLIAAATIFLGGSTVAGASGSACPSSNHANEIVLFAGSGQSAQLGKQFETPLQVQLANTNGCPLSGNLAGININFDAPGSGPSGVFTSTGSTQAVVGTNAQGVATAPAFTANYTAGSYSVDAHSDYGSVNLYLSNTASGLPAAIAVNGGTNQEGIVNTAYAQPLRARITDANGNPVQGATVSFSIIAGATGASASFGAAAATASTDSDGLATSPPLLANGVAGRFSATASVAGVPTVANYLLDNHAATLTIEETSPAAAIATVGARYAQPLRIRLLDTNGQPIEGASVTFTISEAANGAGASFADGQTQTTAITDMNGEATSPPFTANKAAGAYSASATASGARAASYTLTNRAGAPAMVRSGAADGESAAVKSRFPVPFAVTVNDRDGNPISGAVVFFVAPARGASGHFNIRTTKLRRSRFIRVATNKDGIAVAPPFIANGKAGGYVVVASVRGSGKHAGFAVVNERR